jgi:hypothetical protein
VSAPIPRENEFYAALAALVITVLPDGTTWIGPVDNPAAELVASFLEGLLTANPALMAVVRQRLDAAPAWPDGARHVPVAELRDLLDTTAQHGAPAAYPAQVVA